MFTILLLSWRWYVNISWLYSSLQHDLQQNTWRAILLQTVRHYRRIYHLLIKNCILQMARHRGRILSPVYHYGYLCDAIILLFTLRPLFTRYPRGSVFTWHYGLQRILKSSNAAMSIEVTTKCGFPGGHLYKHWKWHMSFFVVCFFQRYLLLLLFIFWGNNKFSLLLVCIMEKQ